MINRDKLTKAIGEVLRRNANNTAKTPIFSQKIEALKVALTADPRGLNCYGVCEQWPSDGFKVSNL